MIFLSPKIHLRLRCSLVLGLIMLSLLAPIPARAEAGRLAHLEAGWGAVSPRSIAPTQKDLGGLKANLFARTPGSGSQVQELAITLATGIISLVVVVYLLVRRYRRQDVDEEEVEREAGEEEEEEL